MANFMGLITESSYGTDPWKEGKKVPYHLRTDGHNPDLNREPQTLTLGSNGVILDRDGYPEPSGDVTTGADVTITPTLMKYLLGNYKFTKDGITGADGTKYNIHEIWGGEKNKVPSFAGEFTYADLMVKRLYGMVMNSLKWSAGKELTTVESNYLYKTEAIKKIDIDAYVKTEKDSLPFIGYDYTMAIGNKDSTYYSQSKLFSSVEFEVQNNHTTDACHVLGEAFYQRQPRMENRNISITGTTLFDEDNFELVVAASHMKYAPNSDGWNTPQKCLRFHAPVTLKAQPCEYTDQFVLFKWPNCIVTLNAIEASNGVIEVEFNMTPKIDKTVTLVDGKTTVQTDMYCQVVNTSSEVA